MTRSRALALAGLGVSAVSLVAVVWWASRQRAPELPSGSGLLSLAAAVGVYAAATALRAERWSGLLKAEGTAASRADAYAITAVGFMGNNVLPARAGDALCVYLMAPRAGARMRDVVGTLIAERVLDVVVLLGLFALLAYGLLRGIETPADSGFATAGAIGLGAVGLGIVVALLLRRNERGRRVAEQARPFLASTVRLRGVPGLTMSGLTLAIWACEAACYVLVAESVGVNLTILESLYVIAVAGVFLLIPSGPGYAGTLDAAVIFGLEAVGEGGGDAISFLIMLRLVLFVPITLAGLALPLARYGGFRVAGMAQAADR